MYGILLIWINLPLSSREKFIYAAQDLHNYLTWGYMTAFAFGSPLHIGKKVFRKLRPFWLEVFLYTHRRGLIKCFWCALLVPFFAVYWSYVLHMGLFHFVAGCAERKLLMASLSKQMRATQTLASVQGHVWCSWQHEKEITHMVEEGRSTSEGWLLNHHRTIKIAVL